ncbi:MAG: Uma2 family endonuclease [Myxococcales bacterium]|nr:Uma2 family endonuclease [Myxococcales bacterium]
MDPAPKKPRATYQDVLDAPEHEVAEIVAGQLHLSPRPAAPHASVMSLLGADLIAAFGRGRGGPGGWTILIEPELHLGEDIVVPDIAGWRHDRLPVVPDAAYVTLAPDWICEVLSRSTEKLDRAEKPAVYAAAGVRWAWLVHPIRRTLEAFRLEAGKWVVLAILKDDERGRIEPFDAIELELSTLWTLLPLPTPASEAGVASWAE